MLRTLLTITMMTLIGPGHLLAQEKGEQVTVTGRAVGSTPAAEEEARLDALRVAVSRICGSFINAQSETEDFALVRDKVLEQPVGFAKIIKVLKGPTVIAGEITEVQLIAEVFPAQFELRWAEFAHIKQREGNPRCVIVILEEDDRHDNIPPITNGIVQTELENFFLKQKVRLMDKGVTDLVRRRDLTLAAEQGDLEKAAAAGAAFKADVVVLGNAEALPGDSMVIGGQKVQSWNVGLTVRAVQTDSAAMLISKTYYPKKALTTRSAKGKQALRRVAEDNAEEVLADIAQAWRERATVGRIVQLTLEPCNRDQFKALQAEMIKMKGITGGEDGFTLEELVNDVASVEASWKYGLNQLADRIEEVSATCEGKKLSFKVTEQSANRLNIRITSTPLATPTTNQAAAE